MLIKLIDLQFINPTSTVIIAQFLDRCMYVHNFVYLLKEYSSNNQTVTH